MTNKIYENTKYFSSVAAMIGWLANEHRLYLEYVISNPGKYHKDEEWNVNELGAYWAKVTIIKKD